MTDNEFFREAPSVVEPNVATPAAGSGSPTRTILPLIVTAVIFFVVGYGSAYLSFMAGAAAQTANVEDTVRSAVSEALSGLNLGAVAAAPTAEPTPAIYDVSVDDDPAIGPEDAPIVMVEFSDFRCPYCARFQTQTLDPLFAQYEGQIRFVYRDFPVVGGDRAAMASECAQDQGVFWEYHDLLFENQSSLGTDEALIELAGRLDIDMDTFSACLSSNQYEEEIQNDFNDGVSYGVRGTPAFFINGRPIVGAQPLASFQQLIDEELAAAG
jgi:protein-disulfide isomerase